MLKMLVAGAALLVVAAPAAAAAPAAKFLADEAKGDTSEAKLGSLIAARGASAATRRYGAMLARDHGAHRIKVDALARQMHVQAPHAMMPEAAAEQAKLQGLSGKTFDAEVRRYMIEDHQKDIADAAAQAKSGDARTAALAKATLPTLRKHLQMARSL